MITNRVDAPTSGESNFVSPDANGKTRKMIAQTNRGIDDLSLHFAPTICSDHAVVGRSEKDSKNKGPNQLKATSHHTHYSGSIFNAPSNEAIKVGKKRKANKMHCSNRDRRNHYDQGTEPKIGAMQGSKSMAGTNNHQKHKKQKHKKVFPNRIRVQTRDNDITIGDTCCQTSTNIPSPKVRIDQIVPLDSPSKLKSSCHETEKRKLSWSKFRKENIGYFPFGKTRTLIPVLLSIAAFALSVCCERSTRYVDLEIPLELDGRYEPVTRIGLFYMEICRANEIVSSDFVSGTVTITKMTFDEYYDTGDPISEVITSLLATDYVPNAAPAQEGYESDERVCEIVNLSSSVIEDSLWNAARLFVGLTTWLGFLMSTLLMFSCFWKTMNLTPIGIGLFFTYIFQSFSFFFFDTDLCKEHGCRQEIGGHLAVAAVVCWFAAGLGVLSIILNQRSRRQRADLIEKRQHIAGMLYEKKRINRVRTFMQTQLSFFYLFSSSDRNAEDRNTSDTESCSSEENYVEGRAEV